MPLNYAVFSEKGIKMATIHTHTHSLTHRQTHTVTQTHCITTKLFMSIHTQIIMRVQCCQLQSRFLLKLDTKVAFTHYLQLSLIRRARESCRKAALQYMVDTSLARRVRLTFVIL